MPAATWTPDTKNSATWTPGTKAGGAWSYDQSGLTYNDSTLTYEGVGTATTWANESKS